MATQVTDHPVPEASVSETAQVAGKLLIPLAARGVIRRRPRMVGGAERIDADRRAVRLLQRLRDQHGDGPLRLRVPGRSLALVLAPSHVSRVLEESPEPFAVANLEKRAAMRQFQPHGLLISHGTLREERRRFNEAVLQSPRPVHTMAEQVTGHIREEVGALLPGPGATRQLSWDAFSIAWWRAIRRIVFGVGARDDDELTDLLTRLRSAANWSYLRPKRRRLRQRFDEALQQRVAAAEPGSLAALLAATPASPGTVPHQQVPQWLFAFDAAAWATIRALALLASHPDQAARVRDDLDGRDLSQPQDLSLLRACVLESLRLWPTTPVILRDTTAETTWETGVLPAGTAVVVYAPLFHRDDRRLAEADRFSPDLWSGERRLDDWPLVPFSGGPAECPGRNLVLLVTSTVLAALLAEHDLRLLPAGKLDARRPLPGTLSPFGLRFKVQPRVR